MQQYISDSPWEGGELIRRVRTAIALREEFLAGSVLLLDENRLTKAALDIAEDHKVWLLCAPRLTETQIPAYKKFEFVVDDATLDIPTDEIAALFAEWLDRAND